MSWPSWQAFWAMGGYALFVWGSYAAVIAAIVIEVFALRRRRREARAALALETSRKVNAP